MKKFVFEEGPKSVTLADSSRESINKFREFLDQNDWSWFTGKTVTLIDGTHTAHRAFNVLSDLETSDGTPTGLILGMLNSIHFYEMKEKPDATFIMWDFGKSKFRTAMYPEYKANRSPDEPTPEDIRRYESLKFQMNEVQDIFNMLGYFQIGVPGVEADDLLGIFSEVIKPYAEKVVIISSDKDLWQLIDRNVFIYDSMQKKWITTDIIYDKFGVDTSKIVFHKALCGDGSDNISGIKGVGGKTAADLLNRFGTIDSIFQNMEEVKKIRRACALEGNEDIVRRNLKLVKIITNDLDVLTDEQIDKIHNLCREKFAKLGVPRSIDRHGFIKKCTTLEFQSIIQFLDKWIGI